MRFVALFLLLSTLSPLAVLSQSSTTIVAGEYFVDDYVDFGEGQPLTISPGETVNITTTLSLTGLTPGTHRLYVRLKDSDGIWSHTHSRLFYQPAYLDTPSVVGFEYFIDEYVDFGQGTFVTLEEDSSEYPVMIPSDLATGVHVLYSRALASDNQWSHIVRRLFLVPDSTEITNIVRLEYYYTDADGNNATQRFTYDAFDPAPSVVLRDEGLDASLLEANRTYILHVQAFTEDGEATPESTEEFTIEVPQPTLSVTTKTENCLGTATLSVTDGEGDYTYSISTDSANYVSDSVFTGLEPGEYIAYSQQDGTVLVDTFEVVAPPVLLLSQVGSSVPPTCDNSNGGSFTVAATGGAGEGYIYSIPERETQEIGTFSVLSAGTYTVTVTDANGCDETLEVIVPPSEGAPETPIITDQLNAIVDSLSTEVILAVENVSGTFTWFLEGDTITGETSNQIILTDGGTYTVTVTNAEGCESTMSDGFEVTAISDLPEQTVLVYPNPVRDELQIVLPRAESRNTVTAIQLFDLQGQTILQKQASGHRTTALPTHSLKPGAYLLRISDGNQIIQRKIQKY